MTEIIETISLKRFEAFIENHGHSIKFHEKNGGLNSGGFCLIEFTTAGELTANGTHCFAYYNGFPDDFDHSRAQTQSGPEGYDGGQGDG